MRVNAQYTREPHFSLGVWETSSGPMWTGAAASVPLLPCVPSAVCAFGAEAMPRCWAPLRGAHRSFGWAALRRAPYTTAPPSLGCGVPSRVRTGPGDVARPRVAVTVPEVLSLDPTLEKVDLTGAQLDPDAACRLAQALSALPALTEVRLVRL